jgi:hypothetical protein
LNAPRKQDEENAVYGKKEREMHQNLGLIASVLALSVLILSIYSVFLPFLPKQDWRIRSQMRISSAPSRCPRFRICGF